jgi:acetyl-CoA carboxylase biotin carboxyl carrier protein
MAETVKATVSGTVWKINVAVGDVVAAGEEVVILESMKMEIPAEPESGGTVTSVLCEEGENVEEDQPLLELE